MRAAVRATLAVAIIVGGCGVLAVIIIGWPESDGGAKVAANGRPVMLTADGNDWPMFRGGQRLLGRASGRAEHRAGPNLLSTGLPDSIALLWKFKTDGAIKSSPAIDDSLVFIGSSDANIYAIDLDSGRQVWAYKTGDAVEAAPCVVEGSVFVGSSDNLLYALDAKTGALKWKYETDGQILGAANWTRSPNGKRIWILVGSYDNKLHCVDSASGKAVWTYETDNFVNGSPAVDSGQAVFGGCDAMIHVVSLADGSRVTQIDTGSFIAASAAFFQGRVYVGNYDNVFVCADVVADEIVWKYSSADAPFLSSPAVGENVVVVGGRDKRVHCLRRDNGELLWSFQTLGEVDSSPAICGDKVVVGSEDGRLYMIRLSDGSQVSSYEIGQPITSSPAVANGMIVVGSDDGYLYAFGANRGKVL